MVTQVFSQTDKSFTIISILQANTLLEKYTNGTSGHFWRLIVTGKDLSIVYSKTNRYGIIKFDIRTLEPVYNRILPQSVFSDIRQYHVPPVTVDDKGNIYMGFAKDGIGFFPPRGQPRLIGKTDGLSKTSVFCFLDFLDGKLYYLSSENEAGFGIAEFDPSGKTSSFMALPPGCDREGAPVVRSARALVADRTRHVLWILADNPSSLFTYKPADRSFTEIMDPQGGRLPIPNALYSDRDYAGISGDTIFIGNNQGLFRYRVSDRSFQILTSSESSHEKAIWKEKPIMFRYLQPLGENELVGMAGGSLARSWKVGFCRKGEQTAETVWDTGERISDIVPTNKGLLVLADKTLYVIPQIRGGEIVLQREGDLNVPVRESPEQIVAKMPVSLQDAMRKMYSGDAKERVEGIRLLGAAAAQAQPAIPYLIERFRDTAMVIETMPARTKTSPADEAARSLALIGQSAVEPLINFLEDRELIGRGYAATALGQIRDKRAVIPLIECLSDSPAIHEQAVCALGELKDERAVEPLVKMFHSNVVQKSSEALVKIASPKCVKPLIELISSAELRSSSLEKEWLGYITTPLIKIGDTAVDDLTAALKHEDVRTRWAAASCLRFIKSPRSAEALAGALSDPDRSVRMNARLALSNLHDAAVPQLLVILNNPDPEIKRTTIIALAGIKDTRVIEALTKLLDDQNPTLRSAALFALRDIDDPRCVEKFAQLVKDQDATVRTSAVTALGKNGSARNLQLVLSVLNDPDEKVRKHAIEALGEIRNPTTIDKLKELVEDDIPPLRIIVIQSLGKINDVRAVKTLVSLLENSDSSIRQASADALAGIRRRAGIVAPETRPTVITALKEMRDATIVEKILAAMKNDQNSSMTRALSKALSIATGADVKGGAEEWQAWWNDNKGAYLKEK